MRATTFLALTVALFATACADRQPKTADTSIPQAPTVSPAGYNFVRLGETARELSLAGDSAAAANPKHASCRFAHPAAFPPGARIMLLDDVVSRIDVDSAGIRTAEGAQVGDAEARIYEIYRGRVASLPHKYLKNGHNLVVWQPSPVTTRYVFETDGKKVLRYRVGRPPAIDLVEGCS
jgi:hypothetical protein